MSDTWLENVLALNRIEQCIKDDLSETEASGLTVRAVYVLWALYRKDGQRPMDLTKAVGTAATSFTPLLDTIVEAGLVRRSANKSDRRSILIHLTAKGRKLEMVIEAAIVNAEVKNGRSRV